MILETNTTKIENPEFVENQKDESGELKPQRKDIPVFIKNQIAELEKEKTRSNFWFGIFSSCIAVLNLTTIILAIYIIYNITSKHVINKDTSVEKVELMAYMVALLTVCIFIVSFIVIYYNTVSRRKRFQKAIEKIEFLALQHKSKAYMFAESNRDEIVLEKIEEVYADVLKKGPKTTIKEVMHKTLLGGTNG